MELLKTNVLLRVGIIILAIILLIIPTFAIENVIRERENRQEEAIREVSSKWADEQLLCGPFVSVPFYKYVKSKAKKDNDTEEKLIQVKEYMHFLPKDLSISGSVLPEKRYRGIYEVVVYNSDIEISGDFERPDISEWEIKEEDVLWDQSTLTFGVNDLRGIENRMELEWNGERQLFNPGTITNDVVDSGINAEVPINTSDSGTYNFHFTLQLKGSQQLYFVPVGEVTDITIKSPWTTPSFDGAFLPDSNHVDKNGFGAKWNVLHLNRNFPQKWIGESNKIKGSQFGIDLLVPIDNYQKSMRSVKYAILVVGCTFLIFFFIEVMNGAFIHPIQYFLVGIALVVFYALLLAISEYVSFNTAFTIAAFMTLTLIAVYVRAVLKSLKLVALIVGVLLILYGFIFVIIQLEEYALLIGAMGLFVILALVMYLSRKIDWFSLRLGGTQIDNQKKSTEAK